MAFQPVVDIGERRIVSYEALVRGPGGEPARSVLDQVIGETRYQFDQACRVRALELAAEAGLDRRLNINFLPNAVYEPKACIRLTLATAERVGIPLDRITFEIVEDERIGDMPHLTGIIQEYRRHGFRIALDDFGSGFAGLAVLNELSPDMVKLDMALIRGIHDDRRKRVITLGMIAVCQTLGIEVVAEGVEAAAELDILGEAGVRLFQGYYFARPALGRLIADAEIVYPG
jgi:EAL domain-containing protein (putative c-di-GMP-specific phosphodiesterase class I)